MDDCEEDCPECPAGLPAWLATFADLMSLLMCFFVLLLSFSEMDVLKYKQIAGSMASAFGVQNTVKTRDIPKGTSIIAQEFSPGRPEPTPITEVKQSTTDVTQSNLDVNCPRGQTPDSVITGEKSDAEMDLEDQVSKTEQQIQEIEQTAMSVASTLSKEVREGKVEIETDGPKLVIRIKEEGSFASGSAIMRPSFVPIMARIREILRGIPGLYTIEGHTDNIPISTARFRSNWELSTSRAVSVAHELLIGGYLDERRFTVAGYGATRPIVRNNSNDNRSKNRRVEIIVEQGKDPNWEEFKIFDTDAVQDVVDQIQDPENPPIFDFDEDEIF